MKTETFERSDKTQGERYTPENGDEFVSTFAKVGTRQNAANVKGKDKPVIIENHFLGVKDKKGKEFTLRVTKGQKKVLDKTEDLTGKTIVFENYEHKVYGTLLGARVKK